MPDCASLSRSFTLVRTDTSVAFANGSMGVQTTSVLSSRVWKLQLVVPVSELPATSVAVTATL